MKARSSKLKPFLTDWHRSFLKMQRRSLLLNFLVYAAALIIWELMLYVVQYGSLKELNPYFLLFVPAQALLLAALTAWLPNKLVSRVVQSVLIVLLLVFYGAQTIYFNIFGSVFSIGMVGVGMDAVENFSWSMASTIKSNIGSLLLLALPAALLLVFTWWKRSLLQCCRFWLNLAAVVLAIVLWSGASVALAAFGTDSTSAFAACHDTHTDTDTTAEKLGVLTCSTLELGVPAPTMGIRLQTEAEGEDTLIQASEPVLLPSVKEEAKPAEPEPAKTEPEEAPEVEEEPVEEQEEMPEEPEEKVLDTSPNIISALDFEALAQKTDNEDIKSLCQYFATVTPSNRNEYTGMFEGYNLIYICAEGWSSLAVDEKITPTMYKLVNEGFVLNNFYNSFRNTTTNGEFIFNTGIWPDVSRDADSGSHSGSMSESSTKYMPYGMGNMFKSVGATAYGYHNYLGSYYGRDESLPNLGFQCKFMDAGMTFSSKWPSSDLEMMEQSVDDYINDDRFVAYYMTFSGHGVYESSNAMCVKNMDFVKENLGGRNFNYCSRGYLACNVELDRALEYLIQRLDEAGKLEKTMIVMVGDHFPYYLSTESVIQFYGKQPDGTFDLYKSSCIIWSGSMKEPIPVDELCCSVDILPTVLNLLGFEFDSRLLAGRDILSDSTHVAVLYNKNFITDIVKYRWSKGTKTWLTDTSAYDSTQLNDYLKSMQNYISSSYSMSLKLMSTDFYRFAWENSGLMK